MWEFLSDSALSNTIGDTAAFLSDGDYQKEVEITRLLTDWRESESFCLFREHLDHVKKTGDLPSEEALSNSLNSIADDSLAKLEIERLNLVIAFKNYLLARLQQSSDDYRARIEAKKLIDTELSTKQDFLQFLPQSLGEEDSLDPAFNQSINDAKQLLDEHKAEAAKVILLGLLDEIPEGNPEAVYRVSTNLGVAYMRCRELELAFEQFENACASKPDSSIAHINMALIYYLNEMYEDAYRESHTAYALDSESDLVISSHLIVISSHDESLLEPFVEDNSIINDSALCQLSLAEIKISRGEYEEALHFIDRTESLDSTISQLRFLKAESLFKIVNFEMLLDTPIDGIPSSEQLRRLEEALTQINLFIDETSSYDYNTYRIPSYTNKSAILALLGKLEEALIACEIALHYDPNYLGGKINKAKLLYQLERYDDLLKFEDSFNEEEVCNIANLIGEVHLKKGNLVKAREYMTKAMEVADSGHIECVFLARLMEIAYDLKDYDTSNSIKERLENEFQQNTTALYSLARQYQKEGAFDKAIENLKQAVHFAGPVGRKFHKLDLAKGLAEMEKYWLAADVYSELIEIDPSDELFWDLMAVHWKNRNYFGAYKRAKEYRLAKRQNWIDSSRQIEIVYLINHDEWNEAKHVYAEIIQHSEESPEDLITKALIEFKVGDSNFAKHIFKQISISELDKDTIPYFKDIQRMMFGIKASL